MPDNVVSKVWWIVIGSNDLARGGCSEEATVLGILHVAEEVAHRNPGSRVVIQGILPRSMNATRNVRTTSGIFSKRHKESQTAEEGMRYQELWPSIEHVNAQLKKFCKNREHEAFIYVDVHALFLGSVTNDQFKSPAVQIVSELMPHYDGRLSAQGHEKWHAVVHQKLMDIIDDSIDSNEVVDKDGYDLVNPNTNEVEGNPSNP